MTGAPSILADLLAECDSHGIRLALAGDGGLTIDAPQLALTPDLLDRLKSQKAALLESIERFEERAAIMEFDGGLSRREAERLARKACFTIQIACDRMPAWPRNEPNRNGPTW